MLKDNLKDCASCRKLAVTRKLTVTSTLNRKYRKRLYYDR